MSKIVCTIGLGDQVILLFGIWLSALIISCMDKGFSNCSDWISNTCGMETYIKKYFASSNNAFWFVV